MKNFKFILAIAVIFTLLVAASNVHAQAKSLTSVTTGKVLDTVSNTGTKAQFASLDGYQDIVTIVVTATKISGTAAGSITCLGSVDGIDYVKVDATTFTVTDVAGAQVTKWQINPSQYAWYKISYTGVGTMAVQLKSKIFARRK